MAYGDWLTRMGYTSQANFVEYGFGQVEPNHLSAQKTGQIYAQLPVASSITMLEQGQFAKYDMANGVVNFTGPGEWMLVYNEIKLYADEYQSDAEFALIKDNYQARVYSPYGGNKYGSTDDPQSRYYNGVDSQGHTSVTIGSTTYTYEDVTKSANPRDPYSTEDPFHLEPQYTEAKMPTGTTMVTRLFKTNIGDWFTTNTVVSADDDDFSDIVVGNYLTVNSTGLLSGATGTLPVTGMVWQIVKVYNLPDKQRAVKVMRIR